MTRTPHRSARAEGKRRPRGLRAFSLVVWLACLGPAGAAAEQAPAVPNGLEAPAEAAAGPQAPSPPCGEAQPAEEVCTAPQEPSASSFLSEDWAEGAASESSQPAGPRFPPAARALPPVTPSDSMAPLVQPVEQHQPPEKRPFPAEERPGAVLKTILGLLALMALAYLGGHRRVLRWEARLGITQVITTGFPFVVMGLVARLPAVGILTDPVLTELSPVLRIALGAIGLVAGFRFEARLLQGMPAGASMTALLSTFLPSVLVVGATAPLLLLLTHEPLMASLRDPVFVRDALILGTAGAMTARTSVRLVGPGGKEGVAGRIIRLEEVAGVAGLAVVAAFFRPQKIVTSWQLPGMVWLLLTIGLGAALGLLFYAILLETRTRPEFMVVTLGSISFAAGAAGYLNLSSIAVAFVAGVMLANFPGPFRSRLREMLERVERPIYLLALFIIGALWQYDDWRGWVLMPVFMASRLAGKWLAAKIAAQRESMPVTYEESRALAISPLGALSIAIVVNAQLLYPGGSISLIVSAVLGGGVLTEIFVQLASRWRFRPSGRPGAGGAPPGPDAERPAPLAGGLRP